MTIRPARALLASFLSIALHGCEIVHCEDCGCGPDCKEPSIESTHFTRLDLSGFLASDHALEGEVAILGTCETQPDAWMDRAGDTLHLRPVVTRSFIDCGEPETAAIQFVLDSSLSAGARWIAYPLGPSTDRYADSVVVLPRP